MSNVPDIGGKKTLGHYDQALLWFYVCSVLVDEGRGTRGDGLQYSAEPVVEGVVSSLLGHSSLRFTEIYIRAVDEEKKKAINSMPSIDIL